MRMYCAEVPLGGDGLGRKIIENSENSERRRPGKRWKYIGINNLLYLFETSSKNKKKFNRLLYL